MGSFYNHINNSQLLEIVSTVLGALKDGLSGIKLAAESNLLKNYKISFKKQ